MTENDILSSIDSEIARLQEARNLLTNSGTGTRGRKSAAQPAKRTMSAEGRRRVAEAQRKRWAPQKKAGEVNGARSKETLGMIPEDARLVLKGWLEKESKLALVGQFFRLNVAVRCRVAFLTDTHIAVDEQRRG